MSNHIPPELAAKLAETNFPTMTGTPKEDDILSQIHVNLTAVAYKTMSRSTAHAASFKDTREHLRKNTMDEFKMLEIRLKNIAFGESEPDHPTHEECVRILGNYFYLMDETTKEGLFQRDLVQKAFDILELGKIPPDPFKGEDRAPERVRL